MITSAFAIGSVTLLVALCGYLLTPRLDTIWAQDLARPKWLSFEPTIPLIWTIIFICGASSAVLLWENAPGSTKVGLLMGLYLLLEIITVAYIPVTLRTRSLKLGTILGGAGTILGIILAVVVWPISQTAAFLLLPYLIWNPIGTYTTRQMIKLNPDAA